MENCSLATEEMDLSQIAAASVNPKIESAGLLVAERKIRSETSVLRTDYVRTVWAVRHPFADMISTRGAGLLC